MWYELAPLKNTSRFFKYKGILKDIEDHLPYNHPYRDNDKGTWVHEGTHGINSRARNDIGGHINCAYCLQDKVFYHNEPDMTLRDVANKIPQELRGRTYTLYMVHQQKWWNDHPLYVIDELSAYLHGTQARLEYGHRDFEVEFSCEGAIDFLGYLAIIYLDVQSDDLGNFALTCKDVIIKQIAEMENRNWDVKELTDLLAIVYKYLPLDYIGV